MGLTNGTSYYGAYVNKSSAICGAVTAYGTLSSSSGNNSSYIPYDNRVGITSDPTKSGLIIAPNNTSVGEVNSLKLGKYILKY